MPTQMAGSALRTGDELTPWPFDDRRAGGRDAHREECRPTPAPEPERPASLAQATPPVGVLRPGRALLLRRHALIALLSAVDKDMHRRRSARRVAANERIDDRGIFVPGLALPMWLQMRAIEGDINGPKHVPYWHFCDLLAPLAKVRC